MQRNLLIILLALAGAAHTGQALAEHTWFDSERDAVHALSDGERLDVFECTQCDVDNASHLTTRSVIARVLEELRVHGDTRRGSFLLRERVEPRFLVVEDSDEEAPVYATRPGCLDQGWAPSLTRWDYDLDKDAAVPQHSACLNFATEVSPIRMSCKGCDLEHLSQALDIREQLKAAQWALFDADEPVNSGVIIVTDSVNSGFRRLDFRAYGDTVYLGPADGDYYRIPLNTAATPGLAHSP